MDVVATSESRTLEAAPLQAETGRTLREIAAALIPGIAERALEVEANQRVSDETIAEFIDTGLTKALLPRSRGGLEGEPADFIAAVIEIGKACTSSAWVLYILAIHHWQLAHFSVEAQEKVYANGPDVLVSSSYTPRGDVRVEKDGIRLSGKWPTSSGVLHSEYAIIGAMVDRGDGPRIQDLVIPLSQVTIHDDWQVMGLRGTGSRSLILSDLFVPWSDIVDRDMVFAKVGPGLSINQGPLYLVDQGVIYSAVACAPALGAAWAFYDEVKRQIKGRTQRVTGQRLDEDKSILLKLSIANAILRDHERNILSHLENAYDDAIQGRAATDKELAEMVYDLSRVTRDLVRIPQELMPVFHAGAAHESNPLQRQYRDILVARQHGTQNADLNGIALLSVELETGVKSSFVIDQARHSAALAHRDLFYR